jgi:hypothetical protein
MVAIGSLWIPIVASAVIVFIASSIMWMVMPHHRGDTKQLPGENEIREAMRKQNPSPGLYTIPYAKDSKEMQQPEIVKKMEEGPVGILTLRKPGKPAMGKSLAQWFVYTLVVSLFVAYLAGRTLPPGSSYLAVFRLAGTVALLAYSSALIPGAIWWGRPWRAVATEVADGILYGLLTAGTFGWLWPR